MAGKKLEVVGYVIRWRDSNGDYDSQSWLRDFNIRFSTPTWGRKTDALVFTYLSTAKKIASEWTIDKGDKYGPVIFRRVRKAMA